MAMKGLNWLNGLMGGAGAADGLQEFDLSSIAPRLNSYGQPIPNVAAAGVRPDFLSLDGLLGTTNPQTGVQTPGWGGLALNTAQGLGNAWMGMKQYGLAKDQFKFQKDMMNKNYEAQKTTLNTQLEDRQRARIASNPGAYQPLAPYLDQNRIR